MVRVKIPKNSGVGGACGCMVIVLLINLLLGGFCFDYALWSLFGKDIPWYGDTVAGLFLGELAIPITVICWILRFWIPTPFFG